MAVSNAPAAACSAARWHLVCQTLEAEAPWVGATKAEAIDSSAAAAAATSAGSQGGAHVGGAGGQPGPARLYMSVRVAAAF